MSSKSTIDSLKNLVEKLSDRDTKLKQDFRLFEDFFKNFPIPVTMWATDLKGDVFSLKTTGFIDKETRNISEAIKYEPAQTSLVNMHDTILKGKRERRIIETKDKTYYVTVVPRRDSQKAIIGASGIAWDVSSNSFILDTLTKIKAASENKSETFESIAEMASEAIQQSRLNFLKNEGPNDE